MTRRSVRPIQPLPLHDAIAYVEQIERTRGIGLLIPGDLHLWGADGGNRSDFFAYLLNTLPYDKVVLLGDIFDGLAYERETDGDREVLHKLRALDEQGKLQMVRGNHDRDLLRSPWLVSERARARAVGADVTRPDVMWLGKSRMHSDVVYAETDGTIYTWEACGADGVASLPGSSDVLVLRVGTGLVYLEHGDRYDRIAKRAHTNNMLERIGRGSYDFMVRFEKRYPTFGGVAAAFKQRVSVWRGVCSAVARGACESGKDLAANISATVSGHTHYPLQTTIDAIPHTNVGSFRGYRPSFVMVTADTGEPLPPVVVQL